jgi:hypothetical protein
LCLATRSLEQTQDALRDGQSGGQADRLEPDLPVGLATLAFMGSSGAAGSGLSIVIKKIKDKITSTSPTTTINENDSIFYDSQELGSGSDYIRSVQETKR